MTDYLKIWAEGLASRASSTLTTSVTVVGEQDRHLGPRWDFARVEITIEPSSTFEVIDKVPDQEALRRLGYPEWVIFGLLDVLMTAASEPVYAVRVLLEKAEFHAVDSSPMAFRHAGRDAGRKIINAMRTGNR